MSDLAKLYQEQILEHHRAPRNAGRLPDPTHSAEAHNPLCGDRVRLTLRLGILLAAAGAAETAAGAAETAATGAAEMTAGAAETAATGAAETAATGPAETAAAALGVLEARCDTQGCALCRASGSMLTELIIGRGVLQVKAWLEDFLALAGAAPGSHEGEDAVLLGAVQPLLEVRKFPSRRRCVTLGWEALRAALLEPKQEPRRAPK